MPVIRLLLLLLILVALAAFTLQNWVSQLPLVFLGKQTLLLPLSVWVLGAIAAGALTTLLLTGLFQLSNTLAVKKMRSRVATASRLETEAAASRSSWDSSSRSASDQTSYTSPTADRFTDETDFGDEEEEADPVDRSDYSSSDQRDRTNYEVPQEPTSSYRSGSSYSYSYKEPNTSGVGRSESVYDADYRVIIPPPQPLEETEDDYGFEDEDFEDETPHDVERRDWTERPDRQDQGGSQNDDWGDQTWRDKGWGDRSKSDW
ncbi:LapA family protein [Trichocoleus sp. FACHB-591]|uniref:LapA family protein n=1 Tax=Trichocoleus sp. FACHB-591 TaxID=2692872 RepID=UPI001686E0D9|nr:LapA family protein [Trichocoleus sp. FACHB-591]MBD2098278.1 LapA family protein [Trichocoleus sp. FACHB-591]